MLAEKSTAVADLLQRAQTIMEMCQHAEKEKEEEEKKEEEQQHEQHEREQQQQEHHQQQSKQTRNISLSTRSTTTTVSVAHRDSVLVQNVRQYVSALVKSEHGESLLMSNANMTQNELQSLARRTAAQAQLDNNVKKTAASLSQHVSTCDYPLPRQPVYGIASRQEAAAAFSSRRPRMKKREMRERMKVIYEVLRPVIESQKVNRKKESLDIQHCTGVTWGSGGEVRYRDVTTKQEVPASEYMRRYFEWYLVSRRKKQQQQRQQRQRQEQKEEEEVLMLQAQELQQQQGVEEETKETTCNNVAVAAAPTLESEMEAAEQKCWSAIAAAMRCFEEDKERLQEQWSCRRSIPSSPNKTSKFIHPRQSEMKRDVEEKTEEVAEETTKMHMLHVNTTGGSVQTSAPLQISPVQHHATRATPGDQDSCDSSAAVMVAADIVTEKDDVTAQLERRRKRRERRRRRRSIVTEIPNFFDGEEEDDEED